MPIFEYRCQDCGRQFEALILPARPTAACPSCQSANLERLLSGFALSTADTRKANAQKSRVEQIAKRKDKIIADEEHRMHHDD